MDKNKPYVKQYDPNGVVLNPIIGAYLHKFESVRTQKKQLRPERFHGESKNYHLTVMRTGRYRRHRQEIVLANGDIKRIEHYLLCN